MSQGNRRRSPRTATSLMGQWSAGKMRDQGTVTDISREGLSLKTSLPPGLKRAVKVFVPLPDSGTPRPQLHLVEGVVVWRKKRSCGVLFSDLCRATSKALTQLEPQALHF